MSRIGKLPLAIPSGVKVEISGQFVSVNGKLGRQSLSLPAEIAIAMEADRIVLKPRSLSKLTRSQWGTSRALLNNLVTGVSQGFNVNLEIEGVGYRASLDGKHLKLLLGRSHDIMYPIPEGITIKVGEKQTSIAISGVDRQRVGQVAAEIRALRKPEPYKGKGIRYVGERILRKEGKKK